MEKKIISIGRVEIPLESVLSELHMDKKGKKADLTERIAAIHKEAMQIAKPAAVYAVFKPDAADGTININGVRISEPFVHEMLSDCDVVAPYVATCGIEVEEWSQSFKGNMFEQFVADAIKEMCLGAAREKLYEEVQTEYFDDDKSISSLNPGSLNKWPITGQKPLFSMLGDVTGDIGVVLSESMMMLPTKSISGIIFQKDKAYHNCQLCPRTDCPSRSAPYEGDG